MTSQDRHEDYEDLIAAHALDALDASEVAEVERVLQQDPRLRDELDDHRAVAAVLAEAVEASPSTPSPAVWEGIAASIAGDSDKAPAELSTVVGMRKQSRFFRLIAAVSIAAIAATAVLAVSVVRLARSDDDPTQVAISALLEDPLSEVVTLQGADGVVADAKIVLGPNGVGYIFADTLPAIAADRTYQLWAVVGDEVISAGVLGADPEQSPFQVVGDVVGFAITNERAGGVPVSEGTLVAAWSRSA